MASPAAARLPATIDTTTGKTTSIVAIPIHKENFTRESVGDPGQLSAQLTRMQKGIDEATKHARCHPAAHSRTFQNLTFGVFGASTTLIHNLGRVAQWRVVRWRNAIGGASIWEGSSDLNSIIFASNVAGIGDIEVY